MFSQPNSFRRKVSCIGTRGRGHLPGISGRRASCGRSVVWRGAGAAGGSSAGCDRLGASGFSRSQFRVPSEQRLSARMAGRRCLRIVRCWRGSRMLSVRAAHPVPVTAKIRIGWDHRSVNAMETARVLEQSGVRRIAVHGRTKEQGYSGRADWSVIGEVAATVGIPVIGNGDIASAERRPETAERNGRRRHDGGGTRRNGLAVDFSEIRAALNASRVLPPPSLEDRWRLICAHCSQEIVWRRDEQMAMKAMRSRLMAYTRGCPGPTASRSAGSCRKSHRARRSRSQPSSRGRRTFRSDSQQLTALRSACPMLFNASEFLFLFLPLTLGVFLLLTRFSGARAAIAWLTLASLFFYSWWNPSYLLLILGSIAVNFSLSRLISAHTSRLSERARAAPVTAWSLCKSRDVGLFQIREFLRGQY